MGLASVKNSGNIVDAFSIATILSYYYFLFNNNNSQPKRKKTHKSLSNNKQPKNELIEAIDNTILLKIASSKPLVFGKAEFLNPGGCVKGKVAVKIIQEKHESDINNE
ncbi:hypothetical protein LguiB_021655 [Lonicera macranthoides]